MSAVRIVSKVNNGQVWVSCSDIIKSLYADLPNASTESQKQYIVDKIEAWENYEESILKQSEK
jgi:hypothetical protein